MTSFEKRMAIILGDVSYKDWVFRVGHDAADNLSFVAGSSLATASLPRGSPVTVCGAASSGLGLATKVKLAAVKQKPMHGTFVHV